MKEILYPLTACLLIAAYLGCLTCSGEGEARYYSPDAYVERANDLIRRGALRAVCVGESRRIETNWQGATKAESQWYRASYLQGDVELFNRDPEHYDWYFLIDDDCRLLGVNELVHTIGLPFAKRLQWRGSIFYSGEGSDAALRSARRSIHLQQPQAPVVAEQVQLYNVGDGLPVNAETVLLLFGNASRPAVRLYHVGEEVVLNNRIREGLGAARLFGRIVPEGRIGRLETGDWLHLEHANRSETFVYLDGEVRPIASAVRRRNEGFHRETVDDALGWMEDPVREEWSPFIEILAQGVDRALARLPDDRAEPLVDGFDLQLTLRRELQKRLNEVMHRHFRSLASSPGVRDDFEAGVTVMNGRTGEVLAAVTYPWVEDIEASPFDDERSRRRRLLNQNFIRHPIGSAGKPFLFAAVANAYPFLMSLEIAGHSSAARHEELLHCWLPLGYQVLGHGNRVDFRRALEVSCNKYTVDLAALALAAERGRTGHGSKLEDLLPKDAEIDWPGGGRSSGISILGRELNYAPDLGEFLVKMRDLPPGIVTSAARRCEAMDRLELARLSEELEILTGISAYRGKAPSPLPEEGPDYFYASYITHRSDLRPWRRMLEFLIGSPEAEHGWPVRAAFQGLSPERVNLAFNNVTDLRRDYVSIALGGSFSSWTNLQLAEAMSRLVTGRQVETRLIQAVLPRPIPGTAGTETPRGQSLPAEEARGPLAEEEPPPELPLRPDVRTAVLQGLQKVVEGRDGTAHELLKRLEELRERYPDDAIYLFSKTGSPILLRPISGATGQALDYLIPGYLSLDNSRLRLQFAGATTAFAPSSSPNRASFERMLGRALERGGFRFGRGRQFRRILSLIDRFARDRRYLTFLSDGEVPRGLDSPLYAVAGDLLLNREDPLFTRRLLRHQGAVYVFSLVRIPGGRRMSPDEIPSPEQLADPGNQVVTVALHLTVGPDSSVAVAATDRLLREIVLLE